MNDKRKNRLKRDKEKKMKKILLFISVLCILAVAIKVKNDIFKTNTNQDRSVDTVVLDNSAAVASDNSAIENTEASNENKEDNILKNNRNLILVNKENTLTEDYVPNDLTIPNVRLTTAENMTEYVRAEVATALESMFNDAEKDGIYLIGISGYRSYEYQQTVYDNNVKNEGELKTSQYVAIPGSSEHQTGLVMDILSNEYSLLDAGFENTNAFKWISENMSKYGFILRYPKGKEDITGYEYEPWHLRYVGAEAAKEIMEKGITLEEYLQQ